MPSLGSGIDPTCAFLLRAQSLDHIARLYEEELRDGQGKCSRGLEVDHQIHLGRSLDRELGWFHALRQLLEQPRQLLTENAHNSWSICDQSTLLRYFGQMVNRRKFQCSTCLKHSCMSKIVEKWRGQHIECLTARRLSPFNGWDDFFGPLDPKYLQRDA